ncbi:serine hydrolase family protein [Aliarcobacter butzleri]|uniref:serine hydrolase family protein n=1 Tax=Aliarcobacter butzleri TaxID=28197 RepID=UPI0021B4B397|nr:serine hydrolase family protein [Aliarcobacter butzleri]MCT7566663.1 serine hydrolase family protein [Aliarcobacter butzleri]MCT7570208.1 serine hydrolase family protein [Aliarcobacter butzleri]MCT7631952.1 serine hydrolase family protein [Aliarcobacter butzleri]
MKPFLITLISLIFISCSSKIPSMEERTNSVLNFASQNNLNKVIINSSNFNIFSLQSNTNSCENQTLNIYIEGDGLSWISKNQISDNPTPINQTLLNLLSLDKSSCKVYLARPCQYISSLKCNKSYWTNKRFSKEIVYSFDEVLNSLKNRYKNKDFNLIGYSGGGAVSTLLASQREDIKNLITIAGNLDIEKWTNFHKISKLDGSLNPANFTLNLENIKQFHIIGNDDKIVPKEIFLSYFSKFSNKKNIEYIYTNSNHSCCFKSAFKEVLNKIEK